MSSSSRKKNIKEKRKKKQTNQTVLLSLRYVLFYSISFLSFPSLCLVLFTFCPDLCFYVIFICFVSSFPPHFDPCWLFPYYYCYLHDIHPFFMLSLAREWLEGEKKQFADCKNRIFCNEFFVFEPHNPMSMISWIFNSNDILKEFIS